MFAGCIDSSVVWAGFASGKLMCNAQDQTMKNYLTLWNSSFRSSINAAVLVSATNFGTKISKYGGYLLVTIFKKYKYNFDLTEPCLTNLICNKSNFHLYVFFEITDRFDASP